MQVTSEDALARTSHVPATTAPKVGTRERGRRAPPSSANQPVTGTSSAGKKRNKPIAELGASAARSLTLDFLMFELHTFHEPGRTSSVGGGHRVHRRRLRQAPQRRAQGLTWLGSGPTTNPTRVAPETPILPRAGGVAWNASARTTTRSIRTKSGTSNSIRRGTSLIEFDR